MTRTSSIVRPRLRTLLLLAVLASGCTKHDDALDLPLAGTLERHRADLAAPVSERLLRIDVHEGQRVRAGQVLAELDTAVIDARIAAADARVAVAQAQLDELVHGPRAESILEARARLAAADARRVREDVELRRLQALLERTLVSRSQVDDARLRRDAATQATAEARAQLQALLAGTRIEQLDRARAELDSARAERARATVDRAQLRIVAPANGRIEALPWRIGERPPAGATIVQLLLDDAPYARVYLPAALRAQAHAGTPARVDIDGQPSLQGRVRFIASEASFTPYFALTQRDRGNLAYLAEIALPAAVDLPAGIPVEVRLAAGSAASPDGAATR